MGRTIPHKRLWQLVREQHGVVSRQQLLELALSSDAIRHRIQTGRLHPVYKGVYAVGRRELPRDGRLMAAVLSCGADAMLSHETAASLWGIRQDRSIRIEVSLPYQFDRRRPGIVIHRRRRLSPAEVHRQRNIPLTSPIRTLIDLATRLPDRQLEAAVNEADKLDLVDPETLRAALEDRAGQRGVPKLRGLLDRHTYVVTDTELERRFLPIVRRAGLPPPLTQQWVNGYRVDFYWPDLGLVVETDGLRYHRTPAQQASDRRRDQAHTAKGLTPLRFARVQVRYEPDQVERILEAVLRRLTSRA